MDKKGITKLNHTKDIAMCDKIPLFTIEQRDQNKEPLDGLTISQVRKAVFGTVEGGPYLTRIKEAVTRGVLVKRDDRYYRDEEGCNHFVNSCNQLDHIFDELCGDSENNN